MRPLHGNFPFAEKFSFVIPAAVNVDQVSVGTGPRACPWFSCPSYIEVNTTDGRPQGQTYMSDPYGLHSRGAQDFFNNLLPVGISNSRIATKQSPRT